MLHAERGVCDATGRLLGGIVVHVASNDYQALPFVIVAQPVLGSPRRGPRGPPPRPRLPDLRVTVYGWSYQPVFTSTEELAWPVPPSTLRPAVRSRDPLLDDIDAGGRDVYHVYFSQNRAGIYALGYPPADPDRSRRTPRRNGGDRRR